MSWCCHARGISPCIARGSVGGYRTFPLDRPRRVVRVTGICTAEMNLAESLPPAQIESKRSIRVPMGNTADLLLVECKWQHSPFQNLAGSDVY
jgi:hypothetical protein